MKKKVNLQEVRQLEKKLFALTDAGLAAELDQLKAQFKGWVLDNFELSSLQQAQVICLPDDFCDSLSESLYRVWKKRLQVQFILPSHLEEYPADDPPAIREIYLSSQLESYQNMGENAPVIKESLQVIISFY